MLAFTCTRISNFGSGVETRLRRVQPLVTAHGAREYVCVCVCVSVSASVCVREGSSGQNKFSSHLFDPHPRS